MALCSSSVNPLARLTKHAYDRSDFNKDRLVQKRVGSDRDGLRNTNHHNSESVSCRLKSRSGRNTETLQGGI